MRIPEAKEILLLYRPGTTDAADPQVAAALALARLDLELGRWFEDHRAFQKAMRARFRQIEVPAHLKSSLLIRGTTQPQVLPPRAGPRNALWLTAAAAVVALIAVASVWLKPRVPDRFADYQARMVGQALREYRMDVVTDDMQQVRQFMARRGAPADYRLPRGLERLQLAGGGFLVWRSQPVAMVCFERSDKQMLYLFVMKRSAVKDPPAAAPQLAKVSQLTAVSWTSGDNTYVLAGPEEDDFLKKYL